MGFSSDAEKDHVRNFSSRDSFAELIGAELLEVSPGVARARMKIRENHLNSFRTVHGGAIFSLADFAFAVACNSHGTVAVAIQVSISYLKAVREGDLFAEAKEISLNPKLGNYRIDVTDDQGDLVAVFHGLAYRKRETIPD